MKYSLFFNAAARREQQTTCSSSDAPSHIDEQQAITIAIYATLLAVAVIAYIS
jgi:hypothetical protein